MSSYDFAKKQLRDHLGSIITEPVSEGFWSIHNSAKELCDQNKQPEQVLRTLQNMLTKIPDWTQETLEKEVGRIKKKSGCDYLDDLIMGVFVSYLKAFASIEYGESDDEIKIEFDRPTLPKFTHELYKHTARKLWQSAFLFKTVGVAPEQQAKNRHAILVIVEEALDTTIRAFLPWSDIAKKYFSNRDSGKPSAAITLPGPPTLARNVSFGEYDEDSTDDEDSEEEEGRPALKLSEEEQSIDIVTLDEPEEVKKVEVNSDENLLAELGEGSETLVIKM